MTLDTPHDSVVPGRESVRGASRATTDIGLYIHVPFCAVKCGYCDFYSMAPRAGGSMDAYVDALLGELDSALSTRDVRVRTIFAGGGTPTFLPMGLLERLFARLGGIAAEHPIEEFTVEANPASLDEGKARLLRGHGVNRISMGAQSFHAEELRFLDRLHHPADVASSVEIVRRAGFAHLNLDLIFGIPGQTRTTWSESLRQAVLLGPDHLACYGLTFEPGTPLRRKLDAGTIAPTPDDLEAEFYLEAIDYLAAEGFRQYEISNFARLGGECRHNLRYWRNEATLGVGPSAASYFEGRRWRNVPDTAEYVRRILAGLPPFEESETLSPLDCAGETAMLQLRLVEGIDRERFRRATGFDPLDLFAEVIRIHADRGLLAVDNRGIALTRRGRLVGDAVIADFLAPSGVGG